MPFSPFSCFKTPWIFKHLNLASSLDLLWNWWNWMFWNSKPDSPIFPDLQIWSSTTPPAISPSMSNGFIPHAGQSAGPPPTTPQVVLISPPLSRAPTTAVVELSSAHRHRVERPPPSVRARLAAELPEQGRFFNLQKLRLPLISIMTRMWCWAIYVARACSPKDGGEKSASNSKEAGSKGKGLKDEMKSTEGKGKPGHKPKSASNPVETDADKEKQEKESKTTEIEQVATANASTGKKRRRKAWVSYLWLSLVNGSTS
jgi:hypothetical protein